MTTELDKITPSNTSTKLNITSVLNETVSNLPSFGNNTVKQNISKVDEVFVKIKELHRIWNHPMSQFMWKHLNLTSASKHRNYRQIVAELSDKKKTFDGIKWGFLENEIKLSELEDKLTEQQNNPQVSKYDIMRTQIEIMKLKESVEESLPYIEGAMKDVLIINDVYEAFKTEHGEFSEEEFEKEEAKSNLIKSLSQCLRDIREHGSITKGEQEYLEQIGVNPTKAREELTKYIVEVETKSDWDVSTLNQFLDEFSTFLLPYVNKKLLAYGVKEGVNKLLTYN